MKIKNLDWDSAFFGFRIGKITINSDKELENGLDLHKEQLDLIYVYATQPLKTIKHIDEKVELIKEINFLEDYDKDNISIWKNNITHELIELAIASGHESRFKKDAKLNFKFKALYQLWMEQSIKGTMADYVLVSITDNKIDGMLTLKLKEHYSEIGLVAVANKGKGIGNDLMQKAFHISKINHKTHIKVTTQKKNEIAMNFYLKNGFEIDKINYVYHYWINK